MRFFAFVSVFLFHGLPGNDVSSHTGRGRLIALVEATVHGSGKNGVALFFLLSAFLITELLRREKILSGSIHLKMFYIRRALRIWPLYYFAVAIGLVISICSVRYRLGITDVVTYAFFIKNWDVAVRGFNWNPIYILWTVSAEEQFYLVWPLAQKLLSRRQLMVLCVTAVILIPLIAEWPHSLFVRTGMTEMVYLFVYFPIGAILSMVLNGRVWQLSGVRCLALLGSGLALWVLGTYVAAPYGDHDGGLLLLLVGRLIIMCGTVLTFFAFLSSGSRWTNKPLIYLGKVSYGLYVFHVMALQLAISIAIWTGLSAGKFVHAGFVLLVAFIMTVAAAAMSYEGFEKRFLLLKERFTIVHSRVA